MPSLASSGARVVAGVVVLIVVGVAVLVLRDGFDAEPPRASAEKGDLDRSAVATAPKDGLPPVGSAGTSDSAAPARPYPPLEAAGEEEESSLVFGFPDPDDPAYAWSQVDMEAIRAEMPTNTYWTRSFPTKDPAVLAERRRVREAENVEYGKVVSGSATENEVHAYFDQQERVSADVVEFTSHVLLNYEDVIPERDRGLFELARRLHLSRLENMPRERQEALVRIEEHARVREAWQRDQELFATPSTER